MAVKTSWSSGDVLTAADLTDTFAAKLDASAYTPGLELITSQSFSTVSTVSVNTCFTSSYDTYRIEILPSAFSTTMSVFMRLRVSGADNSSSYRTEAVENYGSTVSASQNPNGDGTKWTLISNQSSSYPGQCSAVMDVARPALTQGTVAFSRAFTRTAGGVMVGWSTGLSHDVSSAFDGFSIITSTGTISGTVRVYGYRNSL